MLVLLMLTSTRVAMFRSFGLQERIAGNTREKQHAFQAAQSALQFGEWWLIQGNANTGHCLLGALAATQVCSNAGAMATLDHCAVSIGSTYVPSMSTAARRWTVSTSGGRRHLLRRAAALHQTTWPRPERPGTCLPGDRHRQRW